MALIDPGVREWSAAFVRATAGMRVLQEQDNTAAQAIMNVRLPICCLALARRVMWPRVARLTLQGARQAIRAQPFYQEQSSAEVMSGKEEVRPCFCFIFFIFFNGD
jgi:hypothetical protein